jgi:hypothetical protein
MEDFLILEYNNASTDRYNQWANTQVKIFQTLITLEAWSHIKTAIASPESHEYMDFAIPDKLVECFNPTNCHNVADILYFGVTEAFSEMLQRNCERSLHKVAELVES